VTAVLGIVAAIFAVCGPAGGDIAIFGRGAQPVSPRRFLPRGGRGIDSLDAALPSVI
jgi:hypothetical protein